MISKILDRFIPHRRDAHVIDRLDTIETWVAETHSAFVDGGAVTYEELCQYRISTSEQKYVYPTGTGCRSFRIMSPYPHCLRFITTIDPGGFFALHWHPDCLEQVQVLEGTPSSDVGVMQPHDTIQFDANQKHMFFGSQDGKQSIILVDFVPLFEILENQKKI